MAGKASACGKGAIGWPAGIHVGQIPDSAIDVDSNISAGEGGDDSRERKRKREASPSVVEIRARGKALFLDGISVRFIWQAIVDYQTSEVKCNCFSCHANGFG
jgi:hypothetical protein